MNEQEGQKHRARGGFGESGGAKRKNKGKGEEGGGESDGPMGHPPKPPKDLTTKEEGKRHTATTTRRLTLLPCFLFPFSPCLPFFARGAGRCVAPLASSFSQVLPQDVAASRGGRLPCPLGRPFSSVIVFRTCAKDKQATACTYHWVCPWTRRGETPRGTQKRPGWEKPEKPLAKSVASASTQTPIQTPTRRHAPKNPPHTPKPIPTPTPQLGKKARAVHARPGTFSSLPSRREKDQETLGRASTRPRGVPLVHLLLPPPPPSLINHGGHGIHHHHAHGHFQEGEGLRRAPLGRVRLHLPTHPSIRPLDPPTHPPTPQRGRRPRHRLLRAHLQRHQGPGQQQQQQQ